MGRSSRNSAILKAIDELTEALEEVDARVDDLEARLESLEWDAVLGRRRIVATRKASR